MKNKSKLHLFKKYKYLAKEFYSGKTFIAFDTETSGLKSSKDFIIEIGAVKFNCDGIIEKPFDCLIKIPVKLSSVVTKLTHITDSMLEKGMEEKDALKAFMDYIEDEKSFLIAHNAPFDLYFINAALNRAGFDPVKNYCIDTLTLSRWAYPELVELNVKGTFTLSSLAERFNIKVKACHRAFDDARVCMELFNQILGDTILIQKDYKKAMEEKFQLSLF